MRWPWQSKESEFVGDSADLSGLSEATIEHEEDNEDSYANYDFPDLVNEVTNFIDYAAFSKFKELSSNRRQQYTAYDDMTRDIIISSALEMYADDASQYDQNGRMIWVESEDAELQEFCNDLIELLGIEKNLWLIYYNLAEYGDVYIRLFKKESAAQPSGESFNENLSEQLIDQSLDYEDYIEICDNPEDIFELVKNGKTCQYAVTNHEAGVNKQERVELYPPDQFVHIYIENPHIRDKQLFEFKTRDKETNNEKLHRYKVRRGKSMLYDIYATEKEIQLLESSLILNRLSRSAVTRVVTMEVGDMPKPEVRRLTRRVKSKLESKLSINKNTKNISSYNQPSGLDNIIVNPTRNGKGALSVQNIGGDVDVRSLLDLDWFNNKRFGGLKIPKAYMGYDESLGSNAGGTLTKIDLRYGKTIKRLQTCTVAGVTDLINLYLMHRGMEDKINQFKVRVVSPTTVDDLDRNEQMQTNINLITSIMQVTAENQDIDHGALLDYLCTKYLNDSGISKIISTKISKPNPQDQQDQQTSDDDMMSMRSRRSY